VIAEYPRIAGGAVVALGAVNYVLRRYTGQPID
jgi:hypothetical protein